MKTEQRSPEIDPGLFREVMGHYPTGVAVVTGRTAEGELLALVVGTFSSVSMDPPLVSFMPMKTSRTFEQLRECASLCINIVGGEQEELVSSIARRWERKLEDVDWFPSPSGDPVLERSVAWIDVRLAQVVEAGDHWIALCDVRELAVTNPVSPLIFFQGGYGSFVGTSLMARMDHELVDAVEQARCARPTVERLARRIGCEVSLLTAVSRDELASVLSAVGPGVQRGQGMAHRIPLTPPIGDTFMFAQPEDEQERWIRKARDLDDTAVRMYRERLDFVRENGYLLSFLPEEGSAAYDALHEATHQYAQGRLTPAQERQIRSSISRTAVDYGVQEIVEEAEYSVASLVLPVRGAEGDHRLTLRLSQLPRAIRGSEVRELVRWALDAVGEIERAYAAESRQASDGGC